MRREGLNEARQKIGKYGILGSRQKTVQRYVQGSALDLHEDLRAG